MRLFAGTPFDRPPHCDRCGELESVCTCPPPEPERVAPETQTAALRVEKRKRGKVVTVVRGLNPADNDLAGLLTRLKNICGAGGTLADGALEIQGSHIERIRTELVNIGYKVKVAG